MATEEKPPSISVRFRHQESNQFRIIHVDGVFGGPTPGGLLYATIYTQIPPMPSEISQEVLPDGHLGKEIGRIGESVIQRRIEVGLIMDLNMTRALRDWLSAQVETLENAGKPR